MKNADPHTSPKNLPKKICPRKKSISRSYDDDSFKHKFCWSTYCHVSRQLPSDALELALELVGSTILHNSQVKHLQKEKVEPSIRKEKKLTEFASSTCTAIQGSRPHQNTTSLLPCVASTSIRCVGTCVGTCGVYHLTQFPSETSAKRKG